MNDTQIWAQQNMKVLLEADTPETWGKLLSYLSNNANNESRKAYRSHFPDAPLVGASSKVWIAEVTQRGGDKIQQYQQAQQVKQAQEQTTRQQQAADDKVADTYALATSGPAWRSRYKVHANALEYVKDMIEVGGVVSRQGIGGLRIDFPDDSWVCKRNKHLNAAWSYLKSQMEDE